MKSGQWEKQPCAMYNKFKVFLRRGLEMEAMIADI